MFWKQSWDFPFSDACFWYINQSNLALPHSKAKPPTINTIKREKLINVILVIISDFKTIIGYKITNSTSKIKKIRETIKNWREKVWRLFSHGENPHSKGLSLFLSENLFVIKDKAKTIMIKDKTKETKKINLKILINLTLKKLLKLNKQNEKITYKFLELMACNVFLFLWKEEAG